MELSKLSKEIEEVSQRYTNKFGIERNADWFILKLQEELGELIQSYLMMVGQARKKDKTQKELVQDFQDEVADVFSHIILLAKYHDIDIEKAVDSKWLVYNRQALDTNPPTDV